MSIGAGEDYIFVPVFLLDAARYVLRLGDKKFSEMYWHRSVAPAPSVLVTFVGPAITLVHVPAKMMLLVHVRVWRAICGLSKAGAN